MKKYLWLSAWPIAAPIAHAILMLCLTFGIVGGALTLAPACAWAKEYNKGDPFATGDLVWDEQYQTYALAGYTVWLVEEDLGDAPPPFDYPDFLLRSTSLGLGDFNKWGASDFAYSYTDTTNERGIILATDLPTRGHCAQWGRDTSTTNEHKGILLLDPASSGWDQDNTTYHASFLLFVCDESESGTGSSLDQATLSTTRVDAYWRATGRIELQKSSANQSITDGNASYSLEGATYSVTRVSDNEVVDTLVTNEDGYAISSPLPAGLYAITETNAPFGYAIDKETYSVEVICDETATVNGETVVERPIVQAIDLLIQKKDASLTSGAQGSGAQGSASLAGAEFTVWFFSDQHADTTKSPTRGWVFKTDEQGRVYFDADYLISGDPLYYDTGYEGASGEPVLPRGVVVVQETKAPQGYNLDDGSGAPPPQYTAVITGDTDVVIAQNNIQNNSVQRGDYALTKIAPVGINQHDPQSIDPVPVGGVLFQLINEGQAAVVSPEDGIRMVAPGEVVCTIVSDAGGWASTYAGTKTNGWETPATWDGALAYGTYRVHEIIPDEVQNAFEQTYHTPLLTVPDWKVAITRNKQLDPATLVNNKIPQTPVKIVKTDAESNQAIPAVCSFRLYSAEGEPVTYTDRFDESKTIDTWTTNEKGEVTLPMLLSAGTYSIKEVAAPEGYVLSEETVSFTVPHEYRSWDDPITVFYKDFPITGRICLTKTAADTSEPLANAVFDVEAAEDIATPDGSVHAHKGDIVATLTTDEAGTARTDELYLGSYDVYEKRAPEGFALNHDIFRVALTSEGQDVAVVEKTCAVVDQPTVFRIKKVNSETGKPLLGAVFRILSDDGSFDKEIETNEEGIAEISRLKPGVYHAKEKTAPLGYWIEEDAKQPIDLRVDDGGYIGRGDEPERSAALLEVTYPNTPISLKTTATVEGEHVADPASSIVLEDLVTYHGCEPGKEYTVQGILHRATSEEDDTITDAGEVLDASGEAIEASATFIATHQDGTVKVTFDFDASDLRNTSIVAFEELYEGEALVASHRDITDQDQTITFTEGEGRGGVLPEVIQKMLPQTGDGFLQIGALCALITLAVGAGGVAAVHTSRQKLRRRLLFDLAVNNERR